MPVGSAQRLSVLARSFEPRNADAQAADRHGRTGLLVDLGRRAADHARHRQGCRLVLLADHRGLAVVAAIAFVAWMIWELTDNHPVVDLTLFTQPQFCAGHDRVLPGLCGVLRQYRCCCRSGCRPISATPRPGRDLSRRPAALVAVLADAVRRASAWRASMRAGSRPSRSSPLRVSYFMRAGLHDTMPSFWDFVLPLLVQGIAMSTFFVAHDHDLAGRRGAGAHSLGIGHLQFRAHHRRAASPPRSRRPYGTGAKRCTRAVGRCIQPLQSADATGGRASARFRVHRFASLWAFRA